MMSIEAAVSVPLVLWLVFSLLFASPLLYSDSVALAESSVSQTLSDRPPRPDGWIRLGMALGDSASLLSEWIPGLGDFLRTAGSGKTGG